MFALGDRTALLNHHRRTNLIFACVFWVVYQIKTLTTFNSSKAGQVWRYNLHLYSFVGFGADDSTL
jgi:hypothetical protein